MTGRLLVVVAVVAVATAVGRWWQARQGRVRTTPDARRAVGTAGVTSAVLVSTPTCRTCPQVRSALERVAGDVAGFAWSEVDASRDPAFVRRHDVRRAPTVLFRDAGGHVVARAAGEMSAAQVAAAVGAHGPRPVG